MLPSFSRRSARSLNGEGGADRRFESGYFVPQRRDGVRVDAVQRQRALPKLGDDLALIRDVAENGAVRAARDADPAATIVAIVVAAAIAIVIAIVVAAAIAIVIAIAVALVLAIPAAAVFVFLAILAVLMVGIEEQGKRGVALRREYLPADPIRAGLANPDARRVVERDRFAVN